MASVTRLRRIPVRTTLVVLTCPVPATVIGWLCTVVTAVVDVALLVTLMTMIALLLDVALMFVVAILVPVVVAILALVVVTMTTGDIILATVLFAIAGHGGTNDGEGGDTRDDGGGLAAILCANWSRAKPGNGKGGAQDDCDKLAVHDLFPFRFHDSDVKAFGLFDRSRCTQGGVNPFRQAITPRCYQITAGFRVISDHRLLNSRGVGRILPP